MMIRRRSAIFVSAAFVVGLILGWWLARPSSGSSPSDARAAHEHPEVEAWTCAMHPHIRQSEPGSCPICGMNLTSVGDQSAAQGLPAAQVALSARAQALARIRTTPVRRQEELNSQLRLLGRIQVDETRWHEVTAWTGGRIDRLHVRATGERIRRGQAIATLYSPEIYSAHQDLLAAVKQLEAMATAEPDTLRAVRTTLDAAKTRLQLLGVSSDALARMIESRAPTPTFNVRSSFGGTVIKRLATEGTYVAKGTALYRIADLSRLWIQLEAYESDLHRIELGQRARVSVEAIPGAVFEGRVAFIDPIVDSTRRVADVRVEVDNSGRELRPGMFAAAVVESSTQVAESPLVIPVSAPLFTGRRSVVYVELDPVHADGPASSRGVRYEARTVRLGPRVGEHYPVLSGLSTGERVVTRGAFTLDADLQIRGGHSMMMRPDDREAPSELYHLTAEQRSVLSSAIAHYLEIQQALAADDLDGARKDGERLSDLAAPIDSKLVGEAAGVWRAIHGELRSNAKNLVTADSLKAARTAFERLTADVEDVFERFGNPLDTPVHMAFCPMAGSSDGAIWFQRSTSIDNAYFGASMRSCGEIQKTIDAGQHLNAESFGLAPQ